MLVYRVCSCTLFTYLDTYSKRPRYLESYLVVHCLYRNTPMFLTTVLSCAITRRWPKTKIFVLQLLSTVRISDCYMQ